TSCPEEYADYSGNRAYCRCDVACVGATGNRSMLTRLKVRQYSSVKNAGRELIARYPLINAVVSGIQSGLVYADPATDAYFIATKSGLCLFHVPDRRLDAASFDFLKHNRDLPNYIHIYAPQRSFETYIRENLDKCWIRRRAQFRSFRSNTTDDYRRQLPTGYR